MQAKIDELEDETNPSVGKTTKNLKRLQAQRNELNSKGMCAGQPLPRAPLPALRCPLAHASGGWCATPTVRELKEELRLLHEPGSYVGEVIKLMSKKKILVKVQPEGKYVVDFDDKLIKLEDIKPNLRVALRNDTYALHKVCLASSLVASRASARCWHPRERDTDSAPASRASFRSYRARSTHWSA